MSVCRECWRAFAGCVYSCLWRLCYRMASMHSFHSSFQLYQCIRCENECNDISCNGLPCCSLVFIWWNMQTKKNNNGPQIKFNELLLCFTHMTLMNPKPKFCGGKLDLMVYRWSNSFWNATTRIRISFAHHTDTHMRHSLHTKQQRKSFVWCSKLWIFRNKFEVGWWFDHYFGYKVFFTRLYGPQW